MMRGWTSAPETEPESRGCGGCASILSTAVMSVVVVGLVLAIGFWRSDAPRDAPGTPQTTAPPPPSVPAEPSSIPINSAMPEPAPEDDDMIVLVSRDGRTIRAQILTLNERDVFIRREDKAEFRIRLSELNEISLQRVEEFRTKLR